METAGVFDRCHKQERPDFIWPLYKRKSGMRSNRACVIEGGAGPAATCRRDN
ncbi:hypothetical protein NIM87_08565 [Devosia sp. XJ19-1]|uniref:Uncharacterized protein n=1 Tax=Devosia ureilytica TaxID=2952754 RepID=A0A9Q4ANF1_9HYPH|nr:hypothetical protein [Devosia ureilytica]MCP8883549.1 hypothetical protein [Devosia ureilytica]MCP8887157.1 hypothetical protein [Devosia ureilytica]